MSQCVRPMADRRLAVAALVSIALALATLAGCRAQPASSSSGLVYIARHGGSTEVVRVRLADAATQILTHTPDAAERWPFWSEAGQRLVFQRVKHRNGKPADSDLILWTPGAEAPSPLRVSPTRDERWPVWTPDGEALVYAFRGADPRAGIARERIADHHTVLLAVSGPLDFFFRPAVSLDGEQLVAQRRGPNGTGSTLWLLTAGGLPKPLTADADSYDMKPDFSRDGAAVIFSRRAAGGGPRHLVRVAVTGGPVEPITGGEFDDHSSRPSPTRDEIAFVSDRGGNSDIYLTDLAGREPTALTRTAVHEFAPRWSPDGEKLALTTFPAGTRNPEQLEGARIVVLDRSGRILLDVPGAMPDWMPGWP